MLRAFRISLKNSRTEVGWRLVLVFEHMGRHPGGIMVFALPGYDPQSLWGQSSVSWIIPIIIRLRLYWAGQGWVCLWEEIFRGHRHVGVGWTLGSSRMSLTCTWSAPGLDVNVFEYIIHMIGWVQAPGDLVLTLLQDWEETFQVQKRQAGGFLWI